MAIDLSQVEREIAQYDAQAPNIEEQLKKKISDQYNGNKGMIQDVAKYEYGVLPTFYKYFANNAGTGAADMSPAAKMAMAASELSRLGSNADTSRTILKNEQLRQSDLLANMLKQWQLTRQTAVEKYNRGLAEAQLAEQRRANSINQQTSNGFDVVFDEPKKAEPSGDTPINWAIPVSPFNPNQQTQTVQKAQPKKYNPISALWNTIINWNKK